MNKQRPFVFGLTSFASLAAIGALSTSASAQIVIVPSAKTFTDISATGTSPGGAVDDGEYSVTGAQLIAAGFTGNDLLAATNIRIGNNGGVLWDDVSASEIGYVNSTTFMTMPPVGANGATGNGNGTNQFLTVLWDDNVPAVGQGANALDWQVIGSDLIIQWSNEDHFNATGTGTVQYQMVVHSGVTIASGQPLVEYVYNDTLYGGSAYQNDGGSATIGYKNWGVVATANDVQFGTGGGNDTISDPGFGGANMQPKVGGWASSADPALTHAVVIRGSILSPTPYCTAGTSSNGCVALINASANPSVSYANACVITATGVEGQKSGIIFYGINNTSFSPTPWAVASTSFLCVKGPTQRMSALNSGGTVLTCNGVLVQDWNAYHGAHLGAYGHPFVAGGNAFVQAWYRDPPAAKTTNLSNAVRLTFVP